MDINNNILLVFNSDGCSHTTDSLNILIVYYKVINREECIKLWVRQFINNQDGRIMQLEPPEMDNWEQNSIVC